MAKVWKTPLQAKTQVSGEVLSVLSPQQAQPLLHKPLTAQGPLGFSALPGCTLPAFPLAHSRLTAGSRHRNQLIELGLIPPRSITQL